MARGRINDQMGIKAKLCLKYSDQKLNLFHTILEELVHVSAT